MPGVLSAIGNILSIGFPFLFNGLLNARFKSGWKVFWIGAIVSILGSVLYLLLLFGLSFVLRIEQLPISATGQLLIYAGLTGLLTALAVDGMRWVGFNWARERAKSYGSALALAAGSGGVGMAASGLFMFLYWGFVAYMQKVGYIDLPIVNYRLSMGSVTNSPWPPRSFFDQLVMDLALVLKILEPMMMELALSVMVWMAITRKKVAWFAAALLWHTLLYGAYVLFTDGGGISFWTLKPFKLPFGPQAAILSLLFVLNLVFVVWSCLKNKLSDVPVEQVAAEPAPAN